MIFWAQRMLNIDLEGEYADTLELALYNNAMSGLSRDGEHYFYDNPLESDGSHERWEWHPCPCCTMNAARLIASVAGYFYATSADALIVHLYGGTETRLEVAGTRVGVVEESDYPWSGAVAITLDPERAVEFSVKLRIPGWARDATASVNGEAVDVAANTRKGYLEIRRSWAKGDRIALDLPMPAERIYAHPAVRDDFGKVALRRGPLVYCLEQKDNGNNAVTRTLLPRDSALRDRVRDALFGGTVMVEAEGRLAADEDWRGVLYRPAPPKQQAAVLNAIPYFLWANRGPNPMTVWINEA